MSIHSPQSDPTAAGEPPAPQPGRLVIISGPSGAGKSTVVRELIARCDLPLVLSVSATTRPPRTGERDGREYFFLTHDEFVEYRQRSAFLECKEVFGHGHWYGTLREQVATGLNAGRWVILEIDVQGAIAVMQSGEFDPVSVFIHSGGLDLLESRLRGRGTEDESTIRRRLEAAIRELAQMHRYDHEIINGKVGHAVDQICQILHDRNLTPDATRACSKN